MAGLINLRLLTDFFNKIDPSETFWTLRNRHALAADHRLELSGS